MADLLSFPSLPLSMSGRPRPDFDTSVQSSPSGTEGRISRRSEPRYRIPLEIWLRPSEGEDVTFFNFFRAVGGMRDSFLYTYTDSAGVSTVYRCRFDADDLDWLDYESGCYSGSVDLVTVIA